MVSTEHTGSIDMVMTRSGQTSQASKRKRTAAKLGHGPILLSIDEIKPSPENDKLYRPVDPTDPQTIALAKSIREYGMREPMVLTLDDFILSGHRRAAAAKLAGLRRVPVRYENVLRSDPEFVRLLREHNRQREKTLDERLREEVVSVDADESYFALVEYRRSVASVSSEQVALGMRRGRAAITAAKQPMMDAILQILQDRKKFWPLSDRGIHYPRPAHTKWLTHQGLAAGRCHSSRTFCVS